MTDLAHKDRTVQDIIDEMTPEQRETMDIVIGAAVEDEVLDDDSIVERYRALPAEHIYLIDFIVGSVLSQQGGELSQDNLRMTTFLAHFGVKGMKWGVRNVDRPAGGSSGGSASASKSQKKSPAPLGGSGSTSRLSSSTMNTKENRAAARKQVRKGTASAETAHVAALKSTGHRVANAFLGDRTYWKGMAITAGVAGGVVAAGVALPMVLPASTLAAIGGGAYFAGGSLVAPNAAVATAAGATAITGASTLAATTGAYVASVVLQVNAVVRAVRGNTRVDESYARLGSNMIANQKNGAKRTAKILSKDGGISRHKTKKALTQSDVRVGVFLEHHLDATLGSMKPGA